MQKHYDNTHGSIYKFADDHGCNSYEFDIIKRVVRCRKSGEFLEDLQKTKDLIDLYIEEQSKGVEQVHSGISDTDEGAVEYAKEYIKKLTTPHKSNPQT